MIIEKLSKSFSINELGSSKNGKSILGAYIGFKIGVYGAIIQK
jgi:hypothetical protein